MSRMVFIARSLDKNRTPPVIFPIGSPSCDRKKLFTQCTARTDTRAPRAADFARHGGGREAAGPGHAAVKRLPHAQHPHPIRRHALDVLPRGGASLACGLRTLMCVRLCADSQEFIEPASVRVHATHGALPLVGDARADRRLVPRQSTLGGAIATPVALFVTSRCSTRCVDGALGGARYVQRMDHSISRRVTMTDRPTTAPNTDQLASSASSST